MFTLHPRNRRDNLQRRPPHGHQHEASRHDSTAWPDRGAVSCWQRSPTEVHSGPFAGAGSALDISLKCSGQLSCRLIHPASRQRICDAGCIGFQRGTTLGNALATPGGQPGEGGNPANAPSPILSDQSATSREVTPKAGDGRSRPRRVRLSSDGRIPSGWARSTWCGSGRAACGSGSRGGPHHRVHGDGAHGGLVDIQVAGRHLEHDRPAAMSRGPPTDARARPLRSGLEQSVEATASFNSGDPQLSGIEPMGLMFEMLSPVRAKLHQLIGHHRRVFSRTRSRRASFKPSSL